MDSATFPKGIRKVIEQIIEVEPEQIILFGSRANGTASDGSDFDLCVVRPRKAPEWVRLQAELLYDPPTVFPFDVVDFERIDPIFCNQIIATGIVIYEQRPD